ncbi:hypothetical protein [Hoeflea sp.]|uniref:hypothetical protein n=1 Tax=Hoeflea sp. TaxID=1940281 RepID=UPI003B029BF6
MKLILKPAILFAALIYAGPVYAKCNLDSARMIWEANGNTMTLRSNNKNGEWRLFVNGKDTKTIGANMIWQTILARQGGSQAKVIRNDFRGRCGPYQRRKAGVGGSSSGGVSSDMGLYDPSRPHRYGRVPGGGGYSLKGPRKGYVIYHFLN